ncbi:TonB-linked SusC/RagA family outer membrane protein [Pedobacter psychrotolerans]|uniref:SusC/RagA family TonB-linked outer membrane protein n=1 Tax=Pedobacter psychrotolerans TaxID=1843235 RepID=A0A4R2HMP1_9SPHI|nr:SusC/RagA family TonB-linked outer membrane protein [Pedobacter psychrotolerans]TCO29085.1 TonB-linked SusC/RagA family outer membrane protein [Pedobacter psychrotolerans]GGE54038.1 SusC/RagA family TonB-linked outer membrane protein [Pedobacter psychrotolerans]
MFKKIKLLAIVCLLLLSSLVHAQNINISGTVKSASGETLPGVSVFVKGTKQAVTTNNNGAFTISVSGTGTLVFSYIGFATKEVLVTESSNALNVTLSDGENSLDEVVVTALGISKQKKSLGYAIQELKGESLTEARETNLVNALAGKVAGVRVTNSQGDMGSSRVVIRGETSIAGNNQPLFVVDGIPVDNSQLNSAGARDYANAISDINPNDIESISVLKGPNAAALYGSRAAAGVIIIKTKSGKSKKGLGISFNSNAVLESILTLPKYQDVFGQGSEGKFSYVDGKGAGVNDGVDESWGPRMDGRLIPQFFSKGVAVPFVAHPDNVRDFFQTCYSLTNGISIEDAGEKFDYRLSYNNLKQVGIVPNSGQGKNSFTLNTTLRLTPKLTITANANYSKLGADNLPGTGGSRSTSTMLQFAWFGRQVDINQLKNYLDENGNTFNWNNSYYSNPYWVAYENTVSQDRNRLIGSIGLNYKIIDGLNFNFRTGTDYYNDRRKIKIAYGTNGTPFGSYTESAFTVNENNTDATLNYSKQLNDDFSLDVLLGGNIRSSYIEQNDQSAPRLAVAGLYTLNNSRDPLTSSNNYSKLKSYSGYASGQVGFRNYLFANITARNDWSSTLPAQNRSYFYPSFNGSLVLTEAFDIKSAILDYAKIRGGWSKVGKDTSPYRLTNTYTFSAPFGASPQLSPSGTDFDPNLKSETTTSSELGAEAVFFNKRLRFDVSLYNTNSYNQILNVDVSPSTGFRSKNINAGEINNKGIEVQLGITPVKKQFTWDIDVNYAANRSKVVELDQEGLLQNYVIATNSAQVIATVGQPYGTLFGNAFLRDGNGNIVVNATGAPQTDPTKRVLGKYTPDWIGGISNTFSYKGFSLGVLIDASFGGSIYNGTYSTGTYTGVLASTLPGRGAEFGGISYYYPENLKANGAVRLASGTNAPAGATVYDDGMIFDGVTADGKRNEKILSAQTYYKSFRTIDEANIFDASYVKLREIKLSYNLPVKWIKSLNLQGVSVALVGRNLAILHRNVEDIDPEVAFNTGNGQGLESLSNPTTRTYGINLNIKF